MQPCCVADAAEGHTLKLKVLVAQDVRAKRGCVADRGGQLEARLASSPVQVIKHHVTSVNQADESSNATGMWLALSVGMRLSWRLPYAQVVS